MKISSLVDMQTAKKEYEHNQTVVQVILSDYLKRNIVSIDYHHKDYLYTVRGTDSTGIVWICEITKDNNEWIDCILIDVED